MEKHEKLIQSYNNNKFKISVPTWNDKSELLDGSLDALKIKMAKMYQILKLQK